MRRNEVEIEVEEGGQGCWRVGRIRWRRDSKVFWKVISTAEDVEIPRKEDDTEVGRVLEVVWRGVGLGSKVQRRGRWLEEGRIRQSTNCERTQTRSQARAVPISPLKTQTYSCSTSTAPRDPKVTFPSHSCFTSSRLEYRANPTTSSSTLKNPTTLTSTASGKLSLIVSSSSCSSS